MQSERIDSEGGSEAKGRNGYFKVDHFRVAQGHSDGRVWVHFFSKKSNYPGPCYMMLTPEDAEALATSIKEMAVLVRGSFV